MFYRRLLVLALLVVVCTGAMVARLVHIQVMDAEYYAQAAEQQLVRPVRFVSPVRGPIVSRDGIVLAEDRPAWRVVVPYPVLSADEKFIQREARKLVRSGTLPPGTTRDDAADMVRDRIANLYPRLALLTGRPVAELIAKRDEIVADVQTISRIVSKAAGHAVKVREEAQAHPLVDGLGEREQIRLRDALVNEPWMEIESTTVRTSRGGEPFAHVLGRVGQVSPETLDADPFAHDLQRSYRPGERVGTSGVERLAEPILRGQRGYTIDYADGTPIEQAECVDGSAAMLSLHAGLQAGLYRDLANHVKRHGVAVGGAIVVLDIETRELLALVSYPSFDPARFNDDYALWRDDLRRRPLLNRATYGRYPPGSIVKPFIVGASISDGLTQAGTRFYCQGYLHQPNAFRCWIWGRQHTGHGSLDAEEALKASCNIYMFAIGERMGVPRLTEWLSRFGLGERPGTGLLDETAGVNPTPAWLAEVRSRQVQVADARNFSIGQGEVAMSPLQAAVMVADGVSGIAQAPTVLHNDPRDRPRQNLGLTPAAIRTIRRGMHRVVNEPGGTAFKHAHMDAIDIGGKTGTAQASRIIVRDAPRLLYPELGPRGELPKHAWFAGFAPSTAEPKLAVVVFLEFGGGGGANAGPLAKRVFARLIHDGFLDAKRGAKFEFEDTADPTLADVPAPPHRFDLPPSEGETATDDPDATPASTSPTWQPRPFDPLNDVDDGRYEQPTPAPMDEPDFPEGVPPGVG